MATVSTVAGPIDCPKQPMSFPVPGQQVPQSIPKANELMEPVGKVDIRPRDTEPKIVMPIVVPFGSIVQVMVPTDTGGPESAVPPSDIPPLPPAPASDTGALISCSQPSAAKPFVSAQPGRQ